MVSGKSVALNTFINKNYTYKYKLPAQLMGKGAELTPWNALGGMEQSAPISCSLTTHLLQHEHDHAYTHTHTFIFN